MGSQTEMKQTAQRPGFYFCAERMQMRPAKEYNMCRDCMYLYQQSFLCRSEYDDVERHRLYQQYLRTQKLKRILL